MSAADLPCHLASITSFAKSEECTHILQVKHLESERDYASPHLNVFNVLTPQMSDIVEGMPLLELAKAVHGSAKDKGRGNIYIDVGYSSDINSKRSQEHGGVATPQGLRQTTDQNFQVAMLGMTDMADLACQPEVRGKVFRDEERNRLFSGSRLPRNLIETLRVALTNAKYIVGCHADDKNDVIPYFQGVVNYSKWLYIDGEWWRLSLIGYSRKSISGFLKRRARYMPLVERVVHYYNEMPTERKFITSELLDFSSVAPDVTAKRMKPHANKCVFYSAYVTSLSAVASHLRLSKWHVLALLANTVVSETPEFFVHVARIISESRGEELLNYRSLGPIDLSVLYYNLIFDEKERRTKNKIGVPGQRHQPHYNKRQHQSVVEVSVKNLFRLHNAFELTDERLEADPHYYGKAVSFMQDSHKKTGVFGAGALTAQHLIHIGVLCGLFPSGLMDHAEVGESTNSYTYLRRWEGMSDHMEDTRQLLACLSVRLALPPLVVENIICKFGQDQKMQPPTPKWLVERHFIPDGTEPEKPKVWKRKSSSYVDSVYRDQGSLHYIDEARRHVKVTKDGNVFEEPLARRCHPLHPDFQPQITVDPVTYAYWERRVSGRPVIQMTSGTREHLKKMKDGRLTPPGSPAEKPANKFRIRISLGEKRKLSPDAIQGKRAKTRKVVLEPPSESDGEYIESDDDFPHAPPPMLSTASASMKRSERLRQRKLGQMMTTQGDGQHDYDYRDKAGSTTIVTVPPVMDPLQVLAAPAKCRVSLHLDLLAAKALLIRRHEKKNLIFQRCHQTTRGAGTRMLVTAKMIRPNVGSSENSSWQPPLTIGCGIEAALFPGSVVMPDGRRYHENEKLASRFLFIAAVLSGKVPFLEDLLPSARIGGHEEQNLLVFVARGCKAAAPLAAARRGLDGIWAFAFVDHKGLSIGSTLYISSK